MKKTVRTLVLSLICISMLWLTWGVATGCGGTNNAGGTAITLAVKDNGGNTIDGTDDSLAQNGYLKLVFSAALAVAPTTSEITLTCDGTPVTPTINAAVDTDSILTNEYDVMPGLLATYNSCSLTLAYASIADASGNKLGSGYGAYTFSVSAAVAATVKSFVDASSNAVATTGTTGVDPTSFALAFTTPMDVTTVTHNNITMVCGPGNDPVDLTSESEIVAATDTYGISNNEFTIPPPTPYAFQLMSCTITLGTGLKNSDSLAMAQAIYTFTNDCAVSDHFINADTINFTTPTDGCWTIAQAGGALPAQAGDFVFIDSTLDQLGMLQVTAGADWTTTNSPMIYKTISGSDTEWTVTSMLGGFGGAVAGINNNYSIIVNNGGTFMLEMAVVPDTGNCLFQSMTNGVPTPINEVAGCDGFVSLTLRLVRSGSTFTAGYSNNGSEYTDLTPYTDDGSLSLDELGVGMQFSSNVDNFVFNIESFMFDGVTVEGQY